LTFPYISIQEVELNRETKQSDLSIKARSYNELLLSIPKFGLRTFYIKN